MLVAVSEQDAVVGFIRLEMLDGDPHVEQVSVHPDHAGHGIGAARLGWVALNDTDLPPELAAARRQERDLGFDQWPRQAMAKFL